MVHKTFNFVFMTDRKVIGRKFEFENQTPKKLGIRLSTMTSSRPHKNGNYLHCVDIFLFMTDPMTHDSRPSFIQKVHASHVYK